MTHLTRNGKLFEGLLSGSHLFLASGDGGDSPLACVASPEMRELLAARGGVVEE
jgi:hypothetical protein